MGYYCSTGTVAMQTGPHQRSCNAQQNLDHPPKSRKTHDHPYEKNVRYEINHTGRCISHICRRLPIATLMFILLWVNLALAFALMSGAGVVETV